MKKLSLLLLIVTVITAGVSAQRKKATPDETKYRINLPDYWGKGHKVWSALIDKLPEICDELKDKDVCGDNCNPAWSVDFYITEAVIFDYTIMKKLSVNSTNTQLNVLQERARMQNPFDYQRYLSIPDNSRTTWNITTNYGFICYLLLRDYSGKIIAKLVLTDTNEVWRKQHTLTISSSTNPQSFLGKSTNYGAPLPKELMEIAEEKILNL
jgi:hypothetical protein